MPTDFDKSAEEFVKTDEIDKAFDEFEKTFAGLPAWEKCNAPEYLTMPIQELRKKSPDELAEAVLELNRYCLNVQRLINRLRSWERWGKSKLEWYTAINLENISQHYGFNERMLLARNKPEECQKLNAFLRKVEMQVTRLYDVPNNIKAMAESIRELKFVALKREKELNNE